MKKIRVTLTEDIYRILKSDEEDFGINNNKLCNFILEKYKFKRSDDSYIEAIKRQSSTKIIQFDLNIANKNIYYEILKENNVEVEAEFFRELFSFYTSKYKYQRELVVFEELVRKLLVAIRKKNRIKIKYLENIYTLDPFFIKNSMQGDENFLFAYCHQLESYKSFKLKELYLIGILNEKVEVKDKKYIDKFCKNFDPFLINKNTIKVRLTLTGEKLLKSLTNYRPKLIKKSKDIYYFETSNENAKRYFLQFFKEAIILEPEELRKEIFIELEELLNFYK